MTLLNELEYHEVAKTIIENELHAQSMTPGGLGKLYLLNFQKDVRQRRRSPIGRAAALDGPKTASDGPRVPQERPKMVPRQPREPAGRVQHVPC